MAGDLEDVVARAERTERALVEARAHITAEDGLAGALWFAISDPGAFLDRRVPEGPDDRLEPLSAWGARACALVVDALSEQVSTTAAAVVNEAQRLAADHGGSAAVEVTTAAEGGFAYQATAHGRRDDPGTNALRWAEEVARTDDATGILYVRWDGGEFAYYALRADYDAPTHWSHPFIRWAEGHQEGGLDFEGAEVPGVVRDVLTAWERSLDVTDKAEAVNAEPHHHGPVAQPVALFRLPVHVLGLDSLAAWLEDQYGRGCTMQQEHEYLAVYPRA
jgi:hypothetical protein